jgi:hypothetical protein
MLQELSKPFREYAPREQVPLAGYATALLTYAGVLALALAVTRRKRLEPRSSDVLMLGVATHKLSRILAKDFVTAPLRAPFTRREENEGAAEVHDAPRGGALRQGIGFLLTCPYCLGIWVSTGLSTSLLLWPRQARFALRLLSADALSDFLHLSYSRLNESRKQVLAERKQTEQLAPSA